MRQLFSARIWGLMTVIVMALVLVAVTPAASVVGAKQSSGRAQLFASAAAEFNVPEAVLLAVSYNQTRFENHAGQPSVSGGYGLMHLTDEVKEVRDGRGDPARPVVPRTINSATYTLREAAQQLGVSADVLKRDDRQNVRAGAALMAKYAKADHGTLPSSLEGWYGAVTKLSGASSAAAAQDFADDVYETIRDGVHHITTDWQSLDLKATRVGDIPKEALQTLGLPERTESQTMATPTPECPPTLSCRFVPARFAQNNPADPKDYGNYDPANRPSDMKIKYIVIHDTEGSYESAISWFQDPRSYVAAHYVIRSSDGEVTQMVQNKDVGWHAGNWYVNMHSIGIEHEGIAAVGSSWYTEAMYRASAKLVRYLANKYDIPLDREHIIGHDQFHAPLAERVPRMHYDPGPYWDWEHYMNLLGAPTVPTAGPFSKLVTIAPRFETNRPEVTWCEGTPACLPLREQPANFLYVRTAPRHDAPLVTDAGLHPDGAPGTTAINDWSSKATHGQHFAVAERRGNWLAIWFNGQKGWIHNPNYWGNVLPAKGKLVTPREGKTEIPVYGRPLPEASAYHSGVPEQPTALLQYRIKAGQKYHAYDKKAKNDYFHVVAIDRSAPGDGEIVVGNERYIPISYSHRQAYVKASDVRIIETR